MSVLGSRLKEARIKNKLSQIEASKILGISNGTLSGYERNYRDPDTLILEKMAELYEVTTDYLLGLSSEPSLSAEEDKRFTEETLQYFKILESLPDEQRKVFEQQIVDYAKYLRSKTD